MLKSLGSVSIAVVFGLVCSEVNMAVGKNTRVKGSEFQTTAAANDSASTLCQAGHDRVHNNPPRLPANASPADKRWRVKIYMMKNDPDGR